MYADRSVHFDKSGPQVTELDEDESCMKNGPGDVSVHELSPELPQPGTSRSLHSEYGVQFKPDSSSKQNTTTSGAIFRATEILP